MAATDVRSNMLVHFNSAITCAIGTLCQPVEYKYPCQMCNFHAITMFELLDHMEKIQANTAVKCSYCEYKAEDLTNHMISEHGDSAIITIVANQQLLLGEAMGVLQ